MSKDKKKAVRDSFRRAVLSRDGTRCRVCGAPGGEGGRLLDVHHITDRHEMPNGGYVPENGIALCAGCHEKAETWHKGEPVEGFSPQNLYALIGSSRALAEKRSEEAGRDG